ncbi:MAG: ergothioneine biosynthesis protein EgtB [Bacteroidales bacterium]|nr:ergothioneine biosynthesis protein EgtB [Bacteroidales bacterium]
MKLLLIILIFNWYYYNTLGERVVRHKRGDLSRPTVEEVYQYRAWVDKHMEDLLQSAIITPELNYLVTLGLNHEQQHQELFYTDLKYAFSINPLFPKYTDKAYCEESEEGSIEYIKIPEGNYKIGFEGEGFCFDNELTRHTVYLQPFSIRNKLVTNGEYLEFIEDGGYEKFELWHDEALSWLAENQIKHPMYWHKKGDEWFQYTLAGLRKINTEHILTHITYYEAWAFSQWKGQRLPTEFEWEVSSDKFTRGKRWEWTESSYLPYPGYNKADGAVGEYNGKFMVNQKVLRGGSVVTPKGHSRNTYRNFFHPQFGWQFNGIRLAK